MARIKVQSAKQKGRKLQQWACARISEVTGQPWGSTDEDYPISSRPMGQSGTDVRMESHVLKMFPYSIECKAQESWSIHEFIKQASTNTLKNTEWLLICKKSRQEPVVFIDEIAFLDALEINGKSLDQFHLDFHEQKSWYLDVWIQKARYNIHKFLEDTPLGWTIKLTTGKSEPVYMLDAHVFFNLFGKAKMKRTKVKKVKMRRTK